MRIGLNRKWLNWKNQEDMKHIHQRFSWGLLYWSRILPFFFQLFFISSFLDTVRNTKIQKRYVAETFFFLLNVFRYVFLVFFLWIALSFWLIMVTSSTTVYVWDWCFGHLFILKRRTFSSEAFCLYYRSVSSKWVYILRRHFSFIC